MLDQSLIAAVKYNFIEARKIELLAPVTARYKYRLTTSCTDNKIVIDMIIK